MTKEQHEAFLKETPDEAQKRRQQDAGRTNISWTNEIPVEAKKRQQNEVERTTNINRHTLMTKMKIIWKCPIFPNMLRQGSPLYWHISIN
jgi:ribosomal protein S25